VEIEGNIIDVFEEKIFTGRIEVERNRIKKITKINKELKEFITPGFVDAHIHIESSLLCPSRFAEVVVPHGTIATVSDPHEIANVLGIEGIKYMIEDAKEVPLKIFYTAPSCVPATAFETNGAELDAIALEEIFKLERIVALGEVMDFEAVINRDKYIMDKIQLAKKLGKKIDGHAPLLRGEKLVKYVSAGIETDHESVYYEEALEKAKLGMKIMIREGSTAKNMNELIRLAKEGYECFFVGDDVIVTDLIKGHLDLLLKKAVELGLDEIKALKCVTKNPVLHYNLPVGLLREGDIADFLVLNDLKNFKVEKVFIEGELVAKSDECLFKTKPKITGNTIKAELLKEDRLKINAKGKEALVNVIGVIEDQIITKHLTEKMEINNGEIKPDVSKDILKIVVVERYGYGNISLGFIKGFGLKNCAIASSIAHDSHNIIAVGDRDDLICKAVNMLILRGGGLSYSSDEEVDVLELPIAGLMSAEEPARVSMKLEKLHEKLYKKGSKLRNPYITLSFMSLLVIPELKIGDKGLFDVNNKKFIPLVKEVRNN
jgi:adenine deaminase